VRECVLCVCVREPISSCLGVGEVLYSNVCFCMFPYVSVVLCLYKCVCVCSRLSVCV